LRQGPPRSHPALRELLARLDLSFVSLALASDVQPATSGTKDAEVRLAAQSRVKAIGTGKEACRHGYVGTILVSGRARFCWQLHLPIGQGENHG
jgi:hypothetical protein